MRGYLENPEVNFMKGIDMYTVKVYNCQGVIRSDLSVYASCDFWHALEYAQVVTNMGYFCEIEPN